MLADTSARLPRAQLLDASAIAAAAASNLSCPVGVLKELASDQNDMWLAARARCSLISIGEACTA